MSEFPLGDIKQQNGKVLRSSDANETGVNLVFEESKFVFVNF